MSVPQQTLNAVTVTTAGTPIDLGEIKAYHEAFIVISGYGGGGSNLVVLLELSADGVNFWDPPQAVNWAFTGNGTFHISTTASGPPINMLTRYIRVTATFGAGTVATVSAWTLSK